MNQTAAIPAPHPDAERNARAFDRIAHCYDARYSGLMERAETLAVGALVRKFLGPLDHLRVLDVGCGTGLLPGTLRVNPDRYLGIDPSVGMLGRARNKHPGLVFRQGWQEATGTEAGAFDAALALFGVFSYSPTPEAAVQELGRVLKPGGRYVVMALGGSFRKHPEREVCRHHGIESSFICHARAGLRKLFAPLGPCRVLSLSRPPFLPFLPLGAAALALKLESRLLGPVLGNGFRYQIVLGTRA